MTSSKNKAIQLKDAYVSDLISKGQGKQPEIKMPETNHGEVAIDPITAIVGGAALTNAAIGYFMPDILKHTTDSYDGREGEYENDKANRGKHLLNMFTDTGYRSHIYDKEHFEKTGKINKNYKPPKRL